MINQRKTDAALNVQGVRNTPEQRYGVITSSAEHKEILKNQTISIHKDGTIYFNAAPMTRDQLSENVMGLNRETPMVIRADRDIRLQVFVDVLDIINNLGFRKVAIQTEKGGEEN